MVGCGRISERHVLAYRNIDGVEVSVCDINRDSAEKFGNRYHIKWYTDISDALEEERFDVLDVCVPTNAHYDIVMKGLKSGLNVFSEKPLAESSDKIRKIAAQVKRSNKNLMVGYLYRYYPSIQFIKKILEEKIIGDAYYAMFRVGGRGGNRVWKHRVLTCGGAIFEMMVHMIDLILWFFGEIDEANILHKNVILRERAIEGVSTEADAEDVAIALFKTRKDVEVVCESDLITPSYSNTIEIQADNGSMFSSILSYLPTVVYLKERRGVYEKGANMFTFQRTNVFEKELNDFIRLIRSGEKNAQNSVEDSIKIAAVIDRLKGIQLT